ncbi:MULTISPECIES: hypothetical protein [unclassified Micrococcus]|uniref:DUF6941 family protein n=1 Tax=unclassified Micrococcus TaxID=2620948 RepID=UPI00077E0C27|nr:MULTISPECIES: hypothetical protein [unclassified Micrococcus]KYK00858.1 hypothetical protein AUV02_07805 [Micrococcus sp. CH3]KYK04821.1 hypothetical protein AUV08_01455 [Micrococcus sp. CH7]
MEKSPPQKPALDYAFLAEYARVEGNSLTAVGASFTLLEVPSFPLTTTVYVAGRFRAPEHGDPFAVSVTAGKADDEPAITMATTFDPKDALHPYRDRVGITFAVGLPVQFATAGLKQVSILIEDEPVRDLYFEVTGPTDDAE